MDAAYIGIALLILAMILYVSEAIPVVITSILLCILMITFNLAPASIVFGGLIGEASLLIISLMVFGLAFVKTNLAKHIGNYAIKIANGSPLKSVIFILLITIFLSSFMSNTSVTVIMLPILLSILNSTNSNLNKKHWLMPLALAAGIGGMYSVIGSPPQLIVQEILTTKNLETFGFFEYALIGIPLTIIFIIYVIFIGPKIGNRLWKNGKQKENKVLKFEKIDFTKDQFRVLVSFFIVVFLIIFIDIFPDYIYAFFGVFYLILRKIITADYIFKNIDIKTILILGCSIGFASGLDHSNTAMLISDMLFNNVDFENAYLIIVILMIFSFVMTQFMSNTGITAVMVPIALNIAILSEINPKACLAAVALSAGVSFLSPVATPGMTLVMEPGGYKFKDYFMYNIIFSVVCLIFLMIFIPIFWPL